MRTKNKLWTRVQRQYSILKDGSNRTSKRETIISPIQNKHLIEKWGVFLTVYASKNNNYLYKNWLDILYYISILGVTKQKITKTLYYENICNDCYNTLPYYKQ